ncbi:ABC transporter ATP-binding protein [Polaromonas sp. P1-6]|nr:ABC transporter ATP-binding protein [Polaromonas sp. P1-6]
MQADDTLLEIEDVSLAYGRRVVVERLSLTIQPGECVALVGANGAGKSTSLRAIVGIHKVQSGRVRHRGADVTGWSTANSVRAGVILCPEGRHLFPGMSIRDNLLLGSVKTGMDRAQVRERIDEIEVLFPVLNERKNQLAGTLSGGEQQMVALGRALMSQPSLLILDEPSLGLAPLMVERVFDIVKTILNTGCAVLIAEQNVQATLAIAARAYVMEAGRIVASGSAAKLRNDPALLSAFMGVDAAAA